MPESNDVDDIRKKLGVVSGRDFLAQGEANHKERLQNGVTINSLKVFFQKSDLTIQFRGTKLVSYEVYLERCCNSDELLDWVFQLKGKSWELGLIYAFLEILNDACQDVFGFPARTLYQPGNNLDWRNGTWHQSS
ncbi:MAG: hypothetical protein V7L11_02635 [Nostoc sp.]|uniref:hypothetical protein n=1 Tax=Nostoc sp. TaxID=1180 RepID=UPI002FF8E309